MKKIASLSLDLDNQWSYMKTHGDAGWESFPSYLELVVPRALEFLRVRDLQITFFIVGQDAALEVNREPIAAIADAGHEIGNHSFKHEPWLHLYSRAELVEEFERSEEAIESVTGRRTVGFRGPGYSLSPAVLEVLAERGYVYDCSTLPTFIAPLARAYYFLRSPEMSPEEKAKRKKLFGKFADGFQSLRPHVRQVSGRELIEIPVTTMPIYQNTGPCQLFDLPLNFLTGVGTCLLENRSFALFGDRCRAVAAAASARSLMRRRRAGIEIFSRDEHRAG